MKNRRTENNYTEDKVRDFLGAVKMAVEAGKKCKLNFGQICKLFRFGNTTLDALRNCGFIEINGRGFQNWKWIMNHPVFMDDVLNFIAEIDRLKNIHNKKYRGAVSDPAPPKNVVKFTPTPARKAIQVELPMHPVRLTLLNEIRNEICETRRVIENLVNQLDGIENRIDAESTKKAAR